MGNFVRLTKNKMFWSLNNKIIGTIIILFNSGRNMKTPVGICCELWSIL